MGKTNFFVIEICDDKLDKFTPWVNEQLEIMLFKTKKEAQKEIRVEQIRKQWFDVRISEAKIETKHEVKGRHSSQV